MCRQPHGDRLPPLIHLCLFGGQRPQVQQIASSVLLPVGVENFLVASAIRHAHIKFRITPLRKVDCNEKILFLLPCSSQKDSHIFLPGMAVDPIKSGRLLIQKPQRRLFQIQAVPIPHVILYAAIRFLLQKLPGKRPAKVPRFLHSELLSAEQKLLSGMCHKKAQQHAEIRKPLLLLLPRHASGQRSLLPFPGLMEQRKNKALAVLVQKRIGHLSVVGAPLILRSLHVADQTVRPSRIPAEIETESPVLHRIRGLWPLRGAVSDHHDPRALLLHHSVQLLQKHGSVQIFAAAVQIGANPIRRIEIQNGRHIHDPEAIDVVFLRPKQDICDQEILHLRPAELKHGSVRFSPRQLI